VPIDFKFRDYCHPLAIARMRRAFEEIERAEPERVAQWQVSRLREVARAAARAPYYSRVFRDAGFDPRADFTLAEFARLPFLEKETLRSRAPELAAGRGAWHSTSGSTGSPARFLLDARANALEFAYYWYHWSWAGYRLGDRLLELGSHHFVKRGRPRQLWETQSIARRMLVNSHCVSPTSAPAIAQAARAFRPKFVKGMATALAHFARCAQDSGAQCEAPAGESVRAVFSTGEILTSADRALIRKTFGAPVLDCYGQMERVAAISQCLEGGYHVHAAYSLVELVPVANSPRIARVVGTSLHNRAMPLLRYETGDHVQLFEQGELLDRARSCPCGRTLPLIQRILGRAEDTMISPDGRLLNSLAFLFGEVAGIRNAQIVRASPAKLDVLVVPGAEWSERSRERLAALARSVAGESIAVRIATVSESELLRDPSGKRRVIVASVA
jgi:phenylacetate-CoA ligase